MRSRISSGLALKRSPNSLTILSLTFKYSKTAVPATATILLTPEEMPVSDIILKSPISAVFLT